MDDRHALITLGGLSLHSADGRRVGTASKPLALLAIAAAFGDKGVPRHTLIAFLWPDLIRSKANHALSQTLYALRRDLGETVLTGDDILVMNSDVVTWDVMAFRRLIQNGDLEAAAMRYEGPFMEGVSFAGCDALAQWITTQRAILAAENESLRVALPRHTERAVPPRRRLVRPVLATVTIGALFAISLFSWDWLSGATARTRASLFEERNLQQLKLWRERESGPRGRVLIDTPVERSGKPEIAAIAERWRDQLENRIRFQNVADLVPRDTLAAVERMLEEERFTSSVRKLSRLDASISFLSVISERGDSVHIQVYVHRVGTARPKLDREFEAEYRKRAGIPESRGKSSGDKPSLEISPFGSVTAPRDSLFRPMTILTRDIILAIDEMRSCDVKKHAEPYSLPYCWQSTNKVAVVKGFTSRPANRPRYTSGPH